MARSAAVQAARAADALDAFLRDRPRAAGGTAGPEPQRSMDAAGVAARIDRPPAAPGSAPSIGHASMGHASMGHAVGAPLRLPHTDWLRHRLAVTGPAAVLGALRNAASGAGTIPWRLDGANLEEDWFHRLVDPSARVLSLSGARVLAGQLRAAVEHRHAVAVARVGHSHACPFDLHALVPVPADVLDLGPDHPAALAWLWQHWGTTDALRQVAPETTTGRQGPPRPEPGAGEHRLRLTFWAADWTPWRAFERVRADWPALRFDVQPDYDTA